MWPIWSAGFAQAAWGQYRSANEPYIQCLTCHIRAYPGQPSESFASWLSAFKLSSLSLVFTFALPVLAPAAVTSPLARSTFAAADFVDLVVSADLVADDVDDFDGAVPLGK